MLGIISEVVKTLGCLPSPSIREELVVSCIQEKITEMLKHADAFIFLPGDLATLEALITFASWVHLNINQKPIGFLNVNKFYDSMIAFINHAIKNNFILVSVKQLFICSPTTNKLLDLLEAYTPETDPKTLTLD